MKIKNDGLTIEFCCIDMRAMLCNNAKFSLYREKRNSIDAIFRVCINEQYSLPMKYCPYCGNKIEDLCNEQ